MMKRIVFAVATACATAGAQPMPFPEFSAPRRITDGPHDHLFASYYGVNAWSPDGGQFGFNSVHEGSRQLYVMDVR